MNSLISRLGRGLSAVVSGQLPSTLASNRVRILLSADNFPTPAVCVCNKFHFVANSVKYNAGLKTPQSATILPSQWSVTQVHCVHQSSLNLSSNKRIELKEDGKLVTWEFQLQNPYGMLSIETGKSVQINRINVLQHPGGDFAAFHLYRRGDSEMPGAEISVDYDKEMNKLSLVDKMMQTSTKERWVLEVPPYYDLTLEHTGEENDTIQVENLENQTIAIKSVGDIHVHNLKSRDVTLETSEGEVTSTKVLQGNALVKTTKNKGFTADRLQGQQFDIQTEDGSVQCKDIYGNSSKFLSNRGKILLGNVTGECSITTQGNVDIGSMDGSLETKVSNEGSIKAYLVRPTSVSMETDEGDVSISLPSDVTCHLDLTAKCISAPGDLNLKLEEAEMQKKLKGSLNGGHSPVTVSSKEGSISVSVQSWFDSLNLGS